MAFLSIILLLLLIFYCCLILFYNIGWRKIPEITLNPSPSFAPKITVIIPARNEEKNIGKCLDSILKQTLGKSNFEIIVVDDFSEDNTAALVQAYADVRLICLKEYIDAPINSYKKKAIEIAIAQSCGDIIATTDADCIVPPTWLQAIAQCFENNDIKFVAAPVVIFAKRNMLHLFQALDFMVLQGITGAAASLGIHCMCNGANLAYRKSSFYAVEGFLGIDNIASGDDMLLMNKVAKKYPKSTMFLKAKNAIVHTYPMDTWQAFINQRIRWASKADKYENKSMLPVLLAVYFFNLMLFLAVLFILFGNRGSFYIILFAMTIFVKVIVELIFLFPVASFFCKKELLWWHPFFQPLHVLYTILAGGLGKFGKYRWKGRVVK